MKMNGPGMMEKSPEQLLSVFSETKIASWVVIAVAIHIVVLAATSIGYVRDRWIDPEGAAARKAAGQAATSREAANSAPVAAAQTQKVEHIPPGREDAAIPKEVMNTPVVKRITEAAGTNEIPDQPTDIGISIEDTNPR